MKRLSPSDYFPTNEGNHGFPLTLPFSKSLSFVNWFDLIFYFSISSINLNL